MNATDQVGAEPVRDKERAAALSLPPLLTSFAFYLLPRRYQSSVIIQFLPQILAYLCLILWTILNTNAIERLGLSRRRFVDGLRLGAAIGLSLGFINSLVIIWLVPRLGKDIGFLRNTPHAALPLVVMVPWFITGIALLVEVNYRGFLLGRLHHLLTAWRPSQGREVGTLLALLLSALAFAFDPFMVATFKHLHWIAVWDGLIWGVIWLRRRNLYATITAHAVEVMILYLSVRWWLDH
ncbi:MAG TPA: CPBP family glutamic-type intramembrane protease [Nitrospiraceae bacterium]|nr:CPBP family glutamic-type intramembrane protease [Nitrospiraceae bacterium]